MVSEMKTKIFIVRHGKSEGNLKRCFQGRDDMPHIPSNLHILSIAT